MLRGSLRSIVLGSWLAGGVMGCGSSSSPPPPSSEAGARGSTDAAVTTARQALRIVSSPVQNAAVGEPVRYRVVTSAVGAQVEGVQLPPNATLDPSGLLTWTPSESQSGAQTFRVRAKAAGDEVTQEFTITAARPRVQASEQVDSRAAVARTVVVEAPLSRVRGAAVQIEPGSLVTQVTQPITIAEVENAPVPPAARIAKVPASELKPVEFGPSGTAFRKPVRVQLPASEPVLSRGRPEVQTFDYATGKWDKVKVLAYDMKQGMVIAEVKHFSTYVVTPSANVLQPRLTLGPAGTSCERALIVRAPVGAAFASIPASAVNGYAGQAATLADLLAALPAGQAVQVYLRAEARTADGKAQEAGWLLMSAAKLADGKLQINVTSSLRGAAFLKIPGGLAATDPELAAFLGGARAHFIFSRLGSLAGGVSVGLEVSLYLVSAADADRPPVQAVNALATEETSAAMLSAAEAGLDDDCDQAPNAWDPTPQGDPPPVLTGTPAPPLGVAIGAEAKLAVTANVPDVAVTWTASDPSLGLAPSGGTATIKPTVAGVFKVEAIGKKGAAESRFVWEVLVESAAVTARNTPPVVAISASAGQVRAGEAVKLEAVGKDGEQTELAFKWSAKQAGLLSASEGEAVTFTATTPGDYVVTCLASDGLTQSMPATVTLSVLSATANRPPGAPTVTPMLTVLTHEPGAPVSGTLAATATDPDGDPVTFEFAADPAVPPTVALSPMGAMATFTTSADGVFTFYVTAQDAKGARGPYTAVKVSVGPRISAMAADKDGDGYPEGNDCNDGDPKVFPGQKEACGDGVDQDCDGRDMAATDCDLDGDRYPAGKGDCDDRDPNRNPGMPERCDGVDNNCSGVSDEGFDVGKTCTVGVGACQASGRSVCNESFTAVVCTGEPGQPKPESCDGLDNDCNGVVDDVMQMGGDDVKNCGGCNVACATWPNTVPACTSGGCTFRCAPGSVDLDRKPENGCECALSNAGVEVCDGMDNDCNGAVDDAVTERYYPGPDGTVGIGVCTAGMRTCMGGRLVPMIEPRLPSPEICDGLDNDCNGKVDEVGDCSMIIQPPPPPPPGTTDAGAPPDAPFPPPPTGDGGGVVIACPPQASTECRDPEGKPYCTNPLYDSMNCGGCGKRCDSTTYCNMGVCMALPQGCTQMYPVSCPAAAGGSACVNPAFDPQNCGACGVACPAGSGCFEGRCMAAPTYDGGAPPPPPPGSCPDPFKLCRDPSGREYCSDPFRDPANCGGCGIVCQAGTFCQEGRCAMGTYDGGAPPPPTACTAPMLVCKDPTGREYCTDPARDPANCGGCGKFCPMGTYCESGTCLMMPTADGGTTMPPACAAPMSICRDPASGQEYCTDFARDPANCGGCGRSCAAGTYCENGMCLMSSTADGGTAPPPITCSPPMSACKDPTGKEYCTDFARDPANCGGCGKYCPMGTYCDNGACLMMTSTSDASAPPPTCAAPSSLCMDPTSGMQYCTDLSRDNYNCGACRMVCAAGTVCEGGACKMSTSTMDAAAPPPSTCAAGYTQCMDPNTGAQYCANLSADTYNCGACRMVCAAGTYCEAGVCKQQAAMDASAPSMTCTAPYATCTDPVGMQYCANLAIDNNNCGACRMTCGTGTYCEGGTCKMSTDAYTAPTSCSAPNTLCTGASGGMYCTNLSTDRMNCGACGNTCAADQFCEAGVCKVMSSTTMDAAAPPPACSAPNTLCGAMCTNLSNDRYNCGACGNTCAADQFCEGGVCKVMSAPATDGAAPPPGCAAPSTTCMDPVSGTQYCVNLASDISHCGACFNACQAGSTCTNGQCVAP